MITLSFILSFSLTLTQNQFVEFILKNDSSDPITLVIPGAMDPVLAPKSKSHVRLKVGQEVFFYPQKVERVKSNRLYLFTVEEDHLNRIIKVDELIKKKGSEKKSEPISF